MRQKDHDESAEIYLLGKKGSTSIKSAVVTLGFENSSVYMKKQAALLKEDRDDSSQQDSYDEESDDSERDKSRKQLKGIDPEVTSDQGAGSSSEDQ